jgi:hypothetical protein
MKSQSGISTSFGLAVVALVASLTFGVMGITSELASTASAQAPPQFFSWSAPESIDGSFLVMFQRETIPVEGRLVEGDGALYVNPDSGPVAETDVAEIDLVMNGGSELNTTDATLALLVSDPAVTAVHAVGFDTYRVQTTLAATAISDLPGVVDVIPDLGVTAASADEYSSLQWALENDARDPSRPSVEDADIDAVTGWHRARGAGVTVAVIDSGIDAGHPDLAESVWSNQDEICGNGVDDDSNGYVDDCAGWNFADQSPRLPKAN